MAVPSATTIASNAFVADHLAASSALGQRLPELVGDPEAFTAALARGFEELADPVYAAGVRAVTPGLGPVLGVRLALMEAAHKAFARGTRATPPAVLLDCVARLLHAQQRELRWFGMWDLGRLLAAEPARTWQLLREAATLADEWISVDTLAHPWAEGILRDPHRWAELDRLAASPSPWQRRLVGSTVATLPHVRNVPGDHRAVTVERGLAVLGRLIGDAEPDVQKALSWALRNLAQRDVAAVTRFLEAETKLARSTADGHRAWVIRDALSKLPAPVAAGLRSELAGLRRRAGLPSTSLAATAAPIAAEA
jgi:3-methyladenine DNA glycosylase AlkD